MSLSPSVTAWLESLRLRTLPLAFASIVVGSMIAAWHGNLKPGVALLAAGLLQSLSNLANNYGDVVKSSDNQDRIGPLCGMQ